MADTNGSRSAIGYNELGSEKINGGDFSKKERFRALLRNAEGKPCPYCDRRMSCDARDGDRLFPTKDHLVSRSRGGRLTPDNRLIVCARCNEHKGNRTLSEWASHLVATKDWVRLEGVVGVILDVYEELGDDAGYRVVHGSPERVPEARVYNKLRCRFPACACVATCTYKFGDESGKSG